MVDRFFAELFRGMISGYTTAFGNLTGILGPKTTIFLQFILSIVLFVRATKWFLTKDTSNYSFSLKLGIMLLGYFLCISGVFLFIWEIETFIR